MALFTVEGLEGASKGTSIKTIQQVFLEHNQPLAVLPEPGGTPLALSLRQLVKGELNGEIIDADTELLLFFAARNQLDINRTGHLLEQGHVLKDRSWWSTYAYQIHKRIDDDTVYRTLVNRVKQRFPFDAVLYLDVEPEIGLERAASRDKLDRIEQLPTDFFHRAREGYLELARTEPNTHIIDANRSVEAVQADVRAWAEAMIRIQQNTSLTEAS